MTQKTGSPNKAQPDQLGSWLPLVVILLAQIQMAFNVNALPVSIGPIVEDLNTSATSVGTALVFYSLFVAAFVMLGAKIGKLYGERRVFQITALMHGAAMALMALSPSARAMNLAQALAGLAAAALVPTLVVLIAANYRGKQQAQALGIMAGTPAISGALAFFIAGVLGTLLTWRLSFGLLSILSVLVFILSFRLKPITRQPDIKIDGVGALLAALAIILISLGFNNLNAWGIATAKPAAPFALLGLSPAPFMVILGIVFGQGFFAWSHRRTTREKTPLLALEVLDSPEERSNIVSLLVIGALGPAVNFLIPLYIQIVQDQSSLFTAVTVIPYTLSIAGAAILIVRLYDRLTPRQIATTSFVIVAVGLVFLSLTIRNEWSTPFVILCLIMIGLGEGSLITLLFNVMVSASPKELAGDVGALRGVANNLSTALGTAFAGVAAVGLLSLFVTNGLVQAAIPDSLKVQVNLDNINFVTNDQLETVLGTTTATPEQVNEAIRINEDARLRALKASFLILAGFSLLALVPAMGLPNYVPGEVPAPSPPGKGKRKKENASS
ncbi:MAG: MFS transporter [Chloroflexi bacterium]|nr:MFS transporter [Chloroflexota bacterium]MBP7041815.1 MFS transporter [Chloroflexota bacterium]